MQPLARVRAVAVEPRARGAFAKAVTPRVHVGEATRGTEIAQAIGQQHLEIANPCFFGVVTAGVGSERSAPLRGHADIVTELVQERMCRGVRAHVDRVADEPRLRIAPIRARDRVARADGDEPCTVGVEQCGDFRAIERSERDDGRRFSRRGRCGHDASYGRGTAAVAPSAWMRCMTRRARSSASARRRISSSAALASTCVSS